MSKLSCKVETIKRSKQAKFEELDPGSKTRALDSQYFIWFKKPKGHTYIKTYMAELHDLLDELTTYGHYILDVIENKKGYMHVRICFTDSRSFTQFKEALVFERMSNANE